MVGFLQNEWVVGIGGGIVSGIIVFFITKVILQRKDDSKYLQQINQGNLDIIRALKPYISEKGLPQKEIVDAIIISTSRKYKVNSAELYSVRIVCEELIREIIENIYVSADKKKEYCVQLTDYLQSVNKEQDEVNTIADIQNEFKNKEFTERSESRRKMSTTISIIISLYTVLISIAVFFVSSDNLIGWSGLFYQQDWLLVTLIIPMLAVLVSLMLLSYIQLEKNRKYRLRKKEDNKDK